MKQTNPNCIQEEEQSNLGNACYHSIQNLLKSIFFWDMTPCSPEEDLFKTTAVKTSNPTESFVFPSLI
jgi:hypothetical protein